MFLPALPACSHPADAGLFVRAAAVGVDLGGPRPGLVVAVANVGQRPKVGHQARWLDTRGAKLARSRCQSLASDLLGHAAILPGRVLPGQFYLVTRRCTQRTFLLRPDAETNNAFTYS
jgi:hypothetical protein